MTEEEQRRLIESATRAREHAYAPYSGFQVGVAILLRDGRVFEGVNLENCSYGLTVCAERNALAAVALGGGAPGDVVALAVATDSAVLTPPCGACRQVLSEFAGPETPIFIHNVRDGSGDSVTLKDLLPRAFTAADFQKTTD